MTSSSRNKAREITGALGRARQLGLRDWMDMGVAVKELAIARAKLPRVNVEQLMNEPKHDIDAASAAGLIERVSAAIGRAHHRVPWRADCVVQALAARRWLRRHGVPSSISIGVKDVGKNRFDAHAWLTCGDRVVTGGDIAPYAPLQPPASQTAPRISR